MTKQERGELLQVATQLAAAMYPERCIDMVTYKSFNDQAIHAAMDLIEKVDAECGL